MKQESEFPTILDDLCSRMSYKDWRVTLVEMDRGQGSKGLTLVITAKVRDTYAGMEIRINHLFPVPPAAYDERSWRRWLFDCVLLVEQHEACEYFLIDDSRPFAPHHGPGNNPYTIYEHGSDEAVRTSSRGDVKPDPE